MMGQDHYNTVIFMCKAMMLGLDMVTRIIHTLCRLGMDDAVPKFETLNNALRVRNRPPLTATKYQRAIDSAHAMMGHTLQPAKYSTQYWVWMCYSSKFKTALHGLYHFNALWIDVLSNLINGEHYEAIGKDIHPPLWKTGRKIWKGVMTRVFADRRWEQPCWKGIDGAIRAVEFFVSIGINYQDISSFAAPDHFSREYLMTKEINWYISLSPRYTTSAVITLLQRHLINWKDVKEGVIFAWAKENYCSRSDLLDHLLNSGLETRQSLLEGTQTGEQFVTIEYTSSVEVYLMTNTE